MSCSICYNDQKVKKYKDMQKYVKPLYCSCCDTTVFYTSLDDHNKSEHHVIAQRIRNRFPGPIDNIKQKIVEVKMMINYIKKHLIIMVHYQILKILTNRLKQLMIKQDIN